MAVDDIILDTGAADSLIDWEAVVELQIATDDDDQIVPVTGIGRRDYALRKQIDHLQFDSYHLEKPYIDSGNLDGVNGLLGSDILMSGHFVIDLDAMKVYQKN